MSSAVNHRYPDVQGEFEDEDEQELEFEDEFEAEDELEHEAFLGALGGVTGVVKNLLGGDGEAEAEEEFEFEFEAEAENEQEFEDESFVNPVQRIYRDAELMAHLAREAARTGSDQESEAFIGALIPIAARLIPRAADLVIRNAPALIRGATTIARRLRRRAGARGLVGAMPVILQRTAQSLADQALDGRDVNGRTALGTLARITGRVLGDRDTCRSAVRAVTVFDRRYHNRLHQAAAVSGSAPGMAGGPAYSAPSRAGNRRRPAPSGRRRARRNR
jgi:hypothetical protein